jgi:membrane-associated phospholipid phosphatase
MKRLMIIFFVSTFFFFKGFCQQQDSLIYNSDSLSKKNDTIGSLPITFSTYFTLLGSDFKQQFTAPFHQTAKEWLRIGAYTAGMVAISKFVDEPVQHFTIKIYDSSEAARSISNYTTKFGDPYQLCILAGLGTYGFVFNNKKLQTTTLLATQSYLMAEALDRTIKFLTGRQRPEYYDPKNPEPEPAFHGPSIYVGKDINGNKLYGSFPSGHTMNAFAIATVYAMQYKDKPWIPVIAYSSASLVGLSRIVQNKHWTTDVLVAATLGYLDGRQVVNNYHRYAKTKLQQAKRKGELSFNIQYENNQIIPGLVYNFR